MTPRLRRALAEDFARIELQAVQFRDIHRIPNRAKAAALLSGSEVWAIEHDDRPVILGGLIYETPQRARAWSLVSRHMTARCWALAVLKIRARLDELQFYRDLARVEAETRMDFPAGHRFLYKLGFRFEARMPFCGSQGEPFALYSRLAHRDASEPNRYRALQNMQLRVLWEDEISPQRRKAAA